MDIIQQQLLVRDWPLKKDGDELFFGYVVAVGVAPHSWANEGMFLYADFGYGDNYKRYRLPFDCRLVNQLLLHLSANFQTARDLNDIYGKVCVKLTEKGYQVFLP